MPVTSKLLNAVLGDPTKREMKRYQSVIDEINDLEEEIAKLSDEELRAKTQEFRQRLEVTSPDISLGQSSQAPEGGGLVASAEESEEAEIARLEVAERDTRRAEALTELLPEAFAVVREASKRRLGMRPFDVQLIGGIVLHQGRIAEMKTGEGKTLVATLPLYLNALEDKGAHLVTPNDYLSRLGGSWMGPVYNALGLKVGVISHELAAVYDETFDDPLKHPDERLNHWRPVPRREAYQADITYGTNNEFGFDYLRDNMVWEPEQKVQRPLHYAIVDEVNNILVDEARTPLIISGPAEEANQLYGVLALVVKNLVAAPKPDSDDDPDPDADVIFDEKYRVVTPTEAGIDKVESMLQRMNANFIG